jgi:hypothetical protein
MLCNAEKTLVLHTHLLRNVFAIMDQQRYAPNSKYNPDTQQNYSHGKPPCDFVSEHHQSIIN